jgi:hypothetical protein
VKQVEDEMAEIGERVKRIDEILNQNLPSGPERGSKAVEEYLAWLDRVEALKLVYVNANIVTQRLRLFYQGAARSRGRIPDPAPRMREVKNLLETVRHTEQSNLLSLRARRHALQADVQKPNSVPLLLSHRRQQGYADGNTGNDIRIDGLRTNEKDVQRPVQSTHP